MTHPEASSNTPVQRERDLLRSRLDGGGPGGGIGINRNAVDKTNATANASYVQLQPHTVAEIIDSQISLEFVGSMPGPKVRSPQSMMWPLSQRVGGWSTKFS